MIKGSEGKKKKKKKIIYWPFDDYPTIPNDDIFLHCLESLIKGVMERPVWRKNRKKL